MATSSKDQTNDNDERYFQDIVDLSLDNKYISCKRVGDEVRTSIWRQSLFSGDNTRTDYTKTQTNEDRRQSSVHRTKQSIFDYCHVNAIAHPQQTYFLTLTYADNMQDIKKAKKDFRNFVNKYKQTTGVSMAYIGVIEFQERGAIHFHIVIFNSEFIFKNKDAVTNWDLSPYKTTWSDLWGKGFVNIKKVNNTQADKKGNKHSSGVARYLTKYITKNMNDPRLKGHQFHIRSRNLYKPFKMYSEIKPENFETIIGTINSVIGVNNKTKATYTDQRDDLWYLEGRNPEVDSEWIRKTSGLKLNLTNHVE